MTDTATGKRGLLKHRMFAGFMRLLGAYALFFLAARLLFFLAFRPPAGAAGLGAVLYAFWLGLRLDLAFCAITLCPAYLVLHGLSLSGVAEKTLKTFARSFLLLFNTAALILTAAEFPLYNETLTKLNPMALTFFQWPLYLVGQILGATHSYHVIPLLLGLLFFAGKWSLELAGKLFDFSQSRGHAALKPLALCAAIALLLSCGNRDFSPLPPARAFFSSSNFLNQTASNGLYNTLYALAPASWRGAGKPPEVAALASDLNAYFDYSSDEPDDIFRLKPMHGRPNIVIILMESFAAYVGALGASPSLSPNFDRLADQGVLFTNFYANCIGSGRGIISTVSAFPFPPEVDDLSKIKAPSVADYLKPYGYGTYFFNLTGDVENITSFLRHNGFDTAYDKYGLAKTNGGPVPRFDEELFDNADKILRRAKEPFMAMIFTASNHNSSYVPPSISTGTELNVKSSSFVYADWALGEYMKKVRRSPYYKNTIFVLLADHAPRFLPGDEFRAERFHIPLLFLSPLLQNPHRDGRFASQMDVAMTLLRLAGTPLKMRDTSFFGTSLFERKRAPFAYFNNEGMYFYGVALPQGEFLQNLSAEQAGLSAGSDAYRDAGPGWKMPLKAADAILRLTRHFYFTDTIPQWRDAKTAAKKETANK
ncbi:MAG: LTA synthase family protein [Elusimicrobia bacterium]|nr:LTA synthase family protein [Elusimicrobiota bacterium]